MAGFYGNISHSNKTAITFDKIYHSRNEMSPTGDGVFINRYVLIDYDESPISGYYINGDFWTTQTIPTTQAAQNSAKLPRIKDVYYLDLATNRFYLYNAPDQTGAGGYQQVTSPSGYAYYYNIDVQKYGRGYDGTVWIKVYDSTTKEYKYVMVAELNTVVPNFHLVAEQPAMAPIAPWFDSNLTNVDYYLHQQAAMATKIRQAQDSANRPGESGYTVTQRQVSYQGSDTTYGQTATLTDTTYQPAIYFFKDGFAPNTRSTAKSTTNQIGFDWETSGRVYGQTPFVTGNTGEDIMSWYITLPAIGQSVSNFFDHAYGYNSTNTTSTRFRGILQEDNTTVIPSIAEDELLSEKVNNSNTYATVNPNTMIGVINSSRQYLGRVIALGSTRSATVAKAESDTNLICYKDNGSTRSYYIPQYANTWSQKGTVGAKTGDNSKPYYIKSGNIYKLANLNALSSNTPVYQPSTGNQLIWPLFYSSSGTPKGASGENAIAADASANNFGTIYGAIAYMHKILGSHLLDADSRDDRTAIGLMNRIRDLIANIDTQMMPNRVIISDSNGIITSASHTIKVAQQSTSTTTTLTGTSSAAQSFSYINTSKDITLVTKNKWIVIDLDTTNQYIQFAHELSPLTGTSAGTEIKSSATGWGTASSNNDNIITIPTFTFDEGGHLTATSTVSFYLPHSFKTFGLNAQSTAVTELTVASSPANIVADNSADTFSFATGNKWIRMATDSSNDKLTVAHALSALSSTANTEITAFMTGWGSGDNTDNELKIPTFTYDEAGHLIAIGSASFYLPNSFKIFSVAAQSTAVTNSTGNTNSITATNSADTFVFATANKWLTIGTTTANNTLTLGHITSGVTAGNYGLASDETIVTLDVDNAFEVPYFYVDEAGHITSAITHTVTIPESFGKITIGSHNDNTVTEMTVNTNSIEANSIYDELVMQSGNRWIRLAADATNDLIQIAHVVRAIPTTTINHTFNGEASNIIYTTDLTIGNISYDEAGHITGVDYHSYKMPYGYKTITTTNSTSTNSITASIGDCVAGNQIDTFTLSTGNKWLIIATNTANNSVTIGHNKITSSYVGSYGDNAAQTPNYGSTFKVPALTIDEAGHITAISEHTVTIPAGSLSNSDNGNVVTNLSYDSITNATTVSKAYVGDLALTNYAIALANEDIADSDTINEAFGKVQLALTTNATDIDTEATTRENTDNSILMIINGDPEDDESTGLVGRINALENANDAEEDRIAALEDVINDRVEEDPENPGETITIHGLETRVDDLEDDRNTDENRISALEEIINDTEEEDPENAGEMLTIPGLSSRVSALEAIDVQALINAAITDIFSNYEMVLRAPTLTISNTDGVLSIVINNIDENDTITYQWQTRADATSDWENISNATEDEYDTTVNEEYGDFRCIVTRNRNSYSSTANAVITVLAPEPEPSEGD